MIKFFILVISVIAIYGCSVDPVESASNPLISDVKNEVTMSNLPEKKDVSATSFSGIVVRVNLEGGFWAVITDGGTKLDGMIPPHLQIHNQKISGFYIQQQDVMSFHMWGTLVEFSKLKAIGKSPSIPINSKA